MSRIIGGLGAFARILPLVLIALSACRTTAPGPTAPATGEHGGAVDCTTPAAVMIDHARIISGTVVGDSIQLVVEHGGGCGRHDYALHGCEATLKTNPPGVPMQFVHDGHGDLCEALLSDTIRFSLEPVRRTYHERTGSEHGSLVLHVQPPMSSSQSGPVVRFDF
jgi:hypothetical protein